MPPKQMSFEEASVNRVRSHLVTLRKYFLTSVALHGRPRQSVFSLAAGLAEPVDAIVDANPDSEEVHRWGTKFNEFIIQHGLNEPRTGD